MRILAIDTTTEACSVALWNHGHCFSHFEKCHREHTQRVLPLVKEILRRGNITLTDLDALAFGRGPGSFTGVRIGIGIAQGVAFGLNLPMIGISSLMTMAEGVFRRIGKSRVLVAIDARIGAVYWSEYVRDADGVWKGEETEVLYKVEAVDARLKTLFGEWATAGTGWQDQLKIAPHSDLRLVYTHITLPAAEDMLTIARQLLIDGKTVSAACAEPVYLYNELVSKHFLDRK